MQFWTNLWSKPKQAYLIGFTAFMIGMAILLLALWDKIPLVNGSLMGIVAGLCFGTWALFFSLGSMATYAAISSEAFGRRIAELERRLADKAKN